MNQLTTIASLPGGSGSRSALPAEVGEKRFADGGYVESGFYAFNEGGLVRPGPAALVGEKGPELFAPKAKPVTVNIVNSFAIGVDLTEADRDRVRATFRFRRPAAQVQTTPADRQGFEPSDYCERN
jgi:hypothetical protein